MSRSHYSYVLSSLGSFPKDYQEAVKKWMKKNNIIKSDVTDEVVYVKLGNSRPFEFFLSTNKDHTLLNLLDIAYFYYVNFENNERNRQVMYLILLTKVYLKEQYIFTSNDLENGLSFLWEEIAEKVSEDTGQTIELEYNEEYETVNTIINGERVNNLFDPDKKIFNQIFTVVKYD